ncbi:MAG: DNA glycosylase [Opitutae bacterium]
MLDGGQSFRWRLKSGGIWEGVFGKNLVQVKLSESENLRYRVLTGESIEILEYFGQSVDWDMIRDALPWRSDPQLRTCMQEFPGLRILQQPFGETLFSFLCSTAKQISQIKQCCLAVANRLGEDLGGGNYAWPGWGAIAEAGEDVLRECRLGYRSRYIWKVANILRKDQEFELRLASEDYPQAKATLMNLPGVGAKVADCVLLFGCGRLEAFPVDTWINKVMARRYNLGGWDTAKVAQFGQVHFGSAAGLAQQFLFASERAN